MRYLWITSVIMIVASLVLIAGTWIGIFHPVAMVCGILLLWSGIVKIIVLRIWRTTLKAPGVPTGPAHTPTARLFGRSS